MLQNVDGGLSSYPSIYKTFDDIDATSRLKSLLKKTNSKPLPPYQDETHTAPSYSDKELSMETFFKNLRIYKKFTSDNQLPIIKSICEFAHWATTENGAYIFLMRDQLLPYEMIKNNTNKTCYPLILGRKLIKYFYTHESNDSFDFSDSNDDRSYLDFLFTMCQTAVEHHKDFNDFFTHLKPKFLKLIKSNEPFYNYLKKFLSNIKQDKIIVLESGRYGTMPLILKCIDDRVDFRLFCTGPELYKLYEGKVFEKDGLKQGLSCMIEMEQSVSQNQLFVFSSVQKGNAMIKVTNDTDVLTKSFNEITYAVNLYKTTYENNKEKSL